MSARQPGARGVPNTGTRSAAGAGDLLESRARELARRDVTEEAQEHAFEVVLFRLAEEMYAIAAALVREVLPLTQLTPIPCTPPFVAGVFNLRGRILAVIDPRMFYDLPSKGITQQNRVLVLGAGDQELALLVDEVEGMGRVRPKDLRPPPPTLTGIRHEYLEGVLDGSIVLLDGERLMSDEGLVVNEKVGA